MRSYVTRRLLQLVPVLLGISLISFVIVRLAPGNPTALLVDTALLTPAERQRLDDDLGLTGPLPVQFVSVVGRLITGQLHSFRTGQPVLEVLRERFPVTAVLIGGAIVTAVLIGVPLGVLSAQRPYSRTDDWLSIGALCGVSVPSFWLGLILMFVFAGALPLLPVSGVRPAARLDYTWLDVLPHFVLPVAVLALTTLPPIVRHTRSAMLEELGQDYVRTARGKGASERVVLTRHALPNALRPVVTLIGTLVPILIGATAVIETVFAMPGIGRLIVEAALSRDYPTIMTLNLLTATAVLVANILVDVCYVVLDPRIELE
jgi:peptide/nickel transport system permease protein